MSQSRGDMRQMGRNIPEASRNLAERRHKKGECPTCGNKTHKVGLFGKRTALTIEGTCLYGRCLLCNPVEGYTARYPVPQSFVGATIETEDHDPDDGTMVSGITMDHRLIVGASNWNGRVLDEDEEDDSYPDGFEPERHGLMRPEPSVGTIGIDDGRPPDRRRPSRGGDDGSNMSSGRPVGPPLRRYSSKHEERMDHIGVDAVRALDDAQSATRSRRFPRQSRRDENQSPEEHSPRNARKSERSPMRRSSGVLSQSQSDSITEARQNRSMGSSDMERRDVQGRSFPSSTAAAFPPDPADMDRWDDHDPYAVDVHDPLKDDPNMENSDSLFKAWAGSSHEFPMNRETQFESKNDEFALGHQRETFPSRDGGFHGNAVAAHPNLIEDEGGEDEDKQVIFNPDHTIERTPTHDYDMYGGEEVVEDAGIDAMHERSPYSPERPGLMDGARNGWSTAEETNHRGLPDHDYPEEMNRPVSTISQRSGGMNVRTPTQQVIESTGHAKNDMVISGGGGPSVGDPTLKGDQSIDDIPNIIDCLNMDQANTVLRERAFLSLAEIVLSHGQRAKEWIKESSGIETLVQSMWTEMHDASVQSAACELLFALAASVDGEPSSDVLVGENAEGAVDALLIMMQTHITVESIQKSGCGTLCCLATASYGNPSINDGTSSGAVLSVVSAMEMHKNSLAVQEWGIRALYNQCLLSVNAEGNKINLARSGQDGGAGVGVIHAAMETAKSDLVTVELACRLYWCLTASEDIAKIISLSTAPLTAIMNVVHLYKKKPEAAPMTEAAYGALANLARISEQNHPIFIETGAITAAQESIGAFHYDEELYVEACSLLSNLALNPANKKPILDCVSIFSRLIHHYSHNATLQEEALGALLSLSFDSNPNTKMALASELTIGSIIRLLRGQKTSPVMLELASSFLCSLSVLKEAAHVVAGNEGIEVIIAVMKANDRERKIQEAGCTALRNFAAHGICVDLLLGVDSLRTVVSAMSNESESEVVQINACCLLWNAVAKAKKDPVAISDLGGVEQVVKAMQSHMESGELLEMACGALWSLVDNSEDRKKSMLGSGAIDAVTCALVMHPKATHTLEKACGLLANICHQSMMAEAIADSQGISIVVEAMRNNATSLKLLEMGTLVLRNIVLVNPEYALEASDGISTIIYAMKDNPDAVSYQKEACNALWALAAQSEDCKSKIVALDGVTILMHAMDHNSCVSEVQDAARGAISLLALSGG